MSVSFIPFDKKEFTLMCQYPNTLQITFFRILNIYSLIFTASPQLPLPNGITQAPGGDLTQMPRSSPPQPPMNGIVPPHYLAQFPFGHPDLMPQYPVHPYMANLRAMTMHHNTPVPSSEMSLTRLSPTSSRPSSSSPPSTRNASIRVNSNSEGESDDEQIDVVRSAFVPILRPNSVQPDATTVPDRSPDSRVPGSKSDLKAPSLKKTVWRPY